MEIVVRAVAVYVVVWLFFRIAGKRTLNQMTMFDFVVLLIISEATQQAIVGKDYSLTGSALAVATFLGLDVGLSLIKRRFPAVEKVIDSVPVVLIEKGHLHHDRLKKERVDEEDILTHARQAHGISLLEDIDYAVLETSGQVTIIPKRNPMRRSASASEA
jgi:uncharacterized membrane protein YcaP (DUF421 family)